MPICQWTLTEIKPEEIRHYSLQWNIPEVCAKILYSRGIRNKDEIDKFLKFESLSDPFEFTDMKKEAVQTLS